MFPYIEEEFTADEEAILRRYVTNLHLPVFALVNLPEVVKGALFARYSRSPKSLRRLFLDEFVGDLDISGDITLDATVGLARAEQLYEKVFVEYGDDSVAQLGGVHLACEQSSNVLSKVLEWGRLMAYLEQSTRYIAYDNRLESGHYRYYRPTEILESPYGARYVGDMDRMFDTYGELLPTVQASVAGAVPPTGRRHRLRLPPSGQGQGTRRLARPAAGGLASPTSASTARASPTSNCCSACGPIRCPRRARYADMMLTELRKVIPSFLQRVDVAERGGEWTAYLAATRERHGPGGRPPVARRPARRHRRHRRHRRPLGRPPAEVTLLDFDPEGEDKVLAAACFSQRSGSEVEALRRVRLLNGDERVALLSAYVGERTNRRHRPGRAFERTDYRFELVTDYGAFRDLQRHRMLTIEWQRLGISLGYDMPELVADAGVSEQLHAPPSTAPKTSTARCSRIFPSKRRTPSPWPIASATSCSATRARPCT